MNIPFRTTLMLGVGLSLGLSAPAAHAQDDEKDRADRARKADASAKAGASNRISTVAATSASVLAAADPTSFIAKFTRRQERAIVRTGQPSVEVVPGSSLVVNFPSTCVVVWNGWYAEPHPCGPDDVAGAWYAPYASFTDTSIRLEIPAAKLAEQFSLTRASTRVSLPFYSQYWKTEYLGAARAWTDNPGDWVAERTAGKDGVTLVGAASELEVNAPIGSLVCVNPVYMDGLAPREPNGVATNREDPRYAKVLERDEARMYEDGYIRDGEREGYPVFLGRAHMFGENTVPILAGTVAAGASVYAGWMVASKGEENGRFQTTVLWSTFVSLPVGIVGWWKTHAAYKRAGFRKADAVVASWVTSAYEPDGLGIPAVGGDMTCSSTQFGTTKLKLRADVPAGVNFSPVRVWVPNYPESWFSVTSSEDIFNGRSTGDLELDMSQSQLKELFGY